MNGTQIPSGGYKYLNEANTCEVDLSQDAIYLPVLYGIFFVIGTPLNLIGLYGLYHLIKSDHVLPVYVINLLLSDLLQLLTLPLWIDYYSRDHSWRFGTISCRLMAVVFYVSIYTGIGFMCIIALERYVAIAKPLRFQALCQLTFARRLSLSMWVIVTVPPLLAFELLHLTGSHTMCIESYPSEKNYIVYRLITLFLTFILPLTFFLCLHKMTLKALSATSALGPKEKQRVRELLNLLVVIFIVIPSPYHITGCVKYIGLLLHSDVCQWERDVFMPYQLARGLLSINRLLDPVLYTFMRSDFRAAVGRYTRRLQGTVFSNVSPHRSTTGTTISLSDLTARP